MASYFTRLLCTIIIISTIDKSITRIYVNCQRAQHHVRHFNHHNNHRLEHDHHSAAHKHIAVKKNAAHFSATNSTINHHHRHKHNVDGLKRGAKLHDDYRPPSEQLLQILSKVPTPPPSLPSSRPSRRLSKKRRVSMTDFNNPSPPPPSAPLPPSLLTQLSARSQNDYSDYDRGTADASSDEDEEGGEENVRQMSKSRVVATSKADVKCPKCNGTTNVRVSEEELTELRIEFVKNQILQKLRLKERPIVTIADLPRPLYEGTTMHGGDVRSQSKELDDYYARTSQKFIFLEEERQHCERMMQRSSGASSEGTRKMVCFQFRIDDDIEDIDVSTAEIWIYKNDYVRLETDEKQKQQQFIVSEVNAIESDSSNEKMNSSSDSSLSDSSSIAVQSVGVEAGWIRIDIARTTKQWFSRRHLFHIIQISCDSCQLKRNDTNLLLSIEKDYRPFILIDTVSRRKVQRRKRSVNCSVGVTECCREKLYISFKDIGWNDWILHPSGYDAYFCRGSCSTAASITMSNSHYTSVLRKVIYQRESTGAKALELIPCCTAKKFSSLQLLYLDSNNTATSKTLPNMVVESCGCM